MTRRNHGRRSPRREERRAFRPPSSISTIPRGNGPKDLKEALVRYPERVPELVQRKKWPFDRDLIQKAATTDYTPKVFRAIATTLAGQRKHILHKGRLLLPQRDLYKIGIRPRHHMLDGQAIVVAKRLQQHKKLEEAELEYYFPDWMWASCGTSVYYLVECNREAAMMLHQAGFTEVDQVDNLGHSPISVLKIPKPGKIYHGTYHPGTLSDCLKSYLEMCAWYEKKGARLRVARLVCITKRPCITLPTELESVPLRYWPAGIESTGMTIKEPRHVSLAPTGSTWLNQWKWSPTF
ncbi:hypothetical protein BJX68DRAFT_92089 [Aspergillus pseudodeflectus]|uniref:Uncharacterized protein n=1 Tax=Aspergillus pseudodeflectus TaxID=176178 RepID=A0ABR4KCG8_9EURO